MTQELRALCFKLLRKGIGPTRIVSELGVAMGTVVRWRIQLLAERPELRDRGTVKRRRPRYASGKVISSLPSEEARQALELYAEGMSDAAISREMRTTRVRIWGWRQVKFLAPNMAQGWADVNRTRGPAKGGKRVRPAKRPIGPAITPRSNPLYAMIAEAVGRGIAPDLADDAISEIWIAIEEGQLDVAKLAKEAGRYRGKVLGTYASAHTRSLDETIAGTEDFRLIDTLVDDRSSSWLEEMGATVW
jgi:hypothetical protein